MPLKLFVGVFLKKNFCELHIFRINEINASQLSSIVELRFFKKPTAVFLSVELTEFLAISDRASMLLDFLSAVTRTTCIRLEVFSYNIVNCVEPVQGSDKSRSATINVQIIVNTAFQQHIQCRIRPPDNVNVPQWYRE